MKKEMDIEELKDLEQLTYLAHLMRIGKVWSNYGLHRIYFNVGKLINKNLPNDRSYQFWYDIPTKKFASRGLNTYEGDLVLAAINQLIIGSFLEDDLFEI